MREKISAVVEQYVSDPKNENEYKAFLYQVDQERKKLRDSKLGAGDEGYHLITMVPSTITEAIGRVLTPEEKSEWTKFEHKRWFANTYPQFRLPDEV